jgi:DNA mismatch endonuclease (patch repair protein)
MGLRFRKHLSVIDDVRCRPDIVFTRQRLVVFVDGCFWHGCPQHGTRPRTNSNYWRAKIDLNRDRDERQCLALAAAGWSVLRLWEHTPLDLAVERVLGALESCQAAAATGW